MGQKVHEIHRFKQKLCILIAIEYPKQAYERDTEVLHVYVKNISLIMNKKKIINKTVKLRKLVLTHISDFN